MSLRDEIFEQPTILQHLLDTQAEQIQQVAQKIKARNIDYIFLAARGTSDNAGLYAKYLWGSMNQLPIALAAPSLFSLYRQPPRLHNALVMGISQSGQSPDIVGVVAEGGRQGNLTLAITNAPDSPLADAAELVLDVSAGVEKAVAATKTYTAQLMVIAMLAAALSDDPAAQETLHRLPALATEALSLEDSIARNAERYRYMNECVVLGRGYNYATTYEWSLKMKELAYVIAEPYSSADFLHGPIAVVAPGFPVMATAIQGPVYQEVLALLQKLRTDYQAELLVIGNEAQALNLAHTQLQLPANLPEWISPIVTIIPAQLFTYYLTQAKGFDTEAPRGLTKVTKTH